MIAFQRRTLKRLAALAMTTALTTAIAPMAWAQPAFPSRPVTLMVPYPAGGLSDVIARQFNTLLAKQLGQPVVVENLGGVSGAIAAQKVLNAPSDGYYLFQGSPNELILSPLANSAVKFKPEDFRMVQMIGVANMILMSRKDLPASTGDEVVQLARNESKVKPLTYGSVGPGSFYHLLGEHFAKTIGATMTHVPYKGGAPLMQDLMGGQIDLFFTPYGQQHEDLAKAGKIKIIGTLSDERIESMKQFPTINDGKLLKGFSFNIWTAFFVKKDTPEPVVAALNKAIGAVLQDKDLRASLAAQSFDLSRPLSLAEGDKTYRNGIDQFHSIAKSINLQAQ